MHRSDARIGGRICTRAIAGLAAVLSMAGLAQAVPAGLRTALERVPPTQRTQIRDNAAQLAAMDATQRAALQRRLAAWQALPAPERRELRMRWQAWQALPDTERETIRTAATAYAALPDAERLDHLRIQLAVYRLAFARWAGIDDLDLIDGVFCYLPSGEEIRCPDLPDEAELVELIASAPGAPENDPGARAQD